MSIPTSEELAAIRARVDAAEFYSYQHEEAAESAHDVPVLLDAVEALTARIDKALALHVPSPLWHDECADCFEDLPCSTVRALTGEPPNA